MPISIEEVRHVARLARLDLDEAEVFAFQGELNALLGHFADLRELEGTSLEPATDVMSLHNVWAYDSADEALPREEALRNAPVTKAGLFVSPTIIED